MPGKPGQLVRLSPMHLHSPHVKRPAQRSSARRWTTQPLPGCLATVEDTHALKELCKTESDLYKLSAAVLSCNKTNKQKTTRKQERGGRNKCPAQLWITPRYAGEKRTQKRVGLGTGMLQWPKAGDSKVSDPPSTLRTFATPRCASPLTGPQENRAGCEKRRLSPTTSNVTPRGAGMQPRAAAGCHSAQPDEARLRRPRCSSLPLLSPSPGWGTQTPTTRRTAPPGPRSPSKHRSGRGFASPALTSRGLGAERWRSDGALFGATAPYIHGGGPPPGAARPRRPPPPRPAPAGGLRGQPVAARPGEGVFRCTPVKGVVGESFEVCAKV